MRSHPKGGGLVEPDRGVVATAFPAAGSRRSGLRRRIRGRQGEEGRHPAAKPKSQPVGVGSSSQTAAVPETHLCLPTFRSLVSNFSRFPVEWWAPTRRRTPFGDGGYACH